MGFGLGFIPKYFGFWVWMYDSDSWKKKFAKWLYHKKELIWWTFIFQLSDSIPYTKNGVFRWMHFFKFTIGISGEQIQTTTLTCFFLEKVFIWDSIIFQKITPKFSFCFVPLRYISLTYGIRNFNLFFFLKFLELN